jgi:zona occludens toxin (predicted ATPase)
MSLQLEEGHGDDGVDEGRTKEWTGRESGNEAAVPHPSAATLTSWNRTNKFVVMNSLFSSIRSVLWQPLLHRPDLVQQVRHNMRFPLRFPSEVKRHRKSSWDVCIARPGLKKKIMKRILRRKQVLCGF